MNTIDTSTYRRAIDTASDAVDAGVITFDAACEAITRGLVQQAADDLAAVTEHYTHPAEVAAQWQAMKAAAEREAAAWGRALFFVAEYRAQGGAW